MPYDDITKMRAELLERYGPNERPEEFDDGASSLGQNPYIQKVGIFGKSPKFNPSRRTMGLDLPSVKNPVPTAIEDPTTALVPVQQQQPTKINPLEALANMPMTRRKALEIPMNAAISNMGRGLIGEAVTPVIESALKQAAPQVPAMSVEETALANMIKDDVITSADIAMGELEGAPEAVFTFYDDIRQYLESALPSKDLKRLDRLNDIVQIEYNNYLDGEGEISDKYFRSADKLMKMIDENKDSIPLEAFTSGSELGHYMRDSRLDSYNLRTNKGLKDFYGEEYSLDKIKDFMKKNNLYPEEGQEE